MSAPLKGQAAAEARHLAARLLARGQRPAAVAAFLGLSPRTVVGWTAGVAFQAGIHEEREQVEVELLELDLVLLRRRRAEERAAERARALLEGEPAGLDDLSAGVDPGAPTPGARR